MINSTHLRCSVAALALSLSAASALAQEAPAADSTQNLHDQVGKGIPEVVVTAQRRGENLQQVPLAITAVTGEELAARGVGNTVDIQQVVPSLVVNKVYVAADPFIRGVGQVNSGFGTELPVGVYVDGFYMPNAASNLFSFSDIERIEVIKGPQGTLFGRNTSGGVIQIVTRDPTDAFEGKAAVGYGDFDTVSGDLFVNVPLGSNLAATVTGLVQNQGEGWGDNAATGQKTYFKNEVGTQAKVQWTPAETTKVTLRGCYSDVETDTGSNGQIAPGERGADGTPNLGRFTVAHLQRPNKTRQSDVGLTLQHDLGWGQVRSLTRYGSVDSRFFAVNNAIMGLPVAGRSANNTQLHGQSDTLTQELQLLSPDSAAISWIFGLYYLDDSTSLEQGTFGTCVGNVCAPTPVPVQITGEIDTNSYASFAQATFPVLSRTKLTLGLRYTVDEKDFSGNTVPYPGFPNTPVSVPPNVVVHPGDPAPGFPNGIDTSESWSKMTWRVAVDQQLTDDILGYVSYSRGFKSGGYSIINFSNAPYAPEVVDAYEIGLKSSLFDMARVNVAAFYYDYNDVQLRTSAPPVPPGSTFLYNAARSKIQGVDADIEVRVSPQLTLTGGFSVLDAEYTRFPGGACTSYVEDPLTLTGRVVSTPCDLSGSTMIRAPELTAVLGAQYDQYIGVGTLELGLNTSYTSEYFFDVDNRLSQPSHAMVNARLALVDIAGSPWRVGLWVNNLLDKEVFANITQGSASIDRIDPGAPRTYGITVSARF